MNKFIGYLKQTLARIRKQQTQLVNPQDIYDLDWKIQQALRAVKTNADFKRGIK